MERFAIKFNESNKLNLNKICRLCGTDNSAQISILNNLMEFGDGEPELWKKILDCVGIRVLKNDKMPQNVCVLCHDKILDFFEFREMCIFTNEQTRNLLGLPPKNEIEIKNVTIVAYDNNTTGINKESNRNIKKARRKKKLEYKNEYFENDNLVELDKLKLKEDADLLGSDKKRLLQNKKPRKRKAEVSSVAAKLPKTDDIFLNVTDNMSKHLSEGFGRGPQTQTKRKKTHIKTETTILKSKTRKQNENISHFKNVTEAESRENCSICLKLFSSWKLEEHLKSEHVPRVVPYHCVRCDETIMKKADIKSHNLWHKLSRTPFSCGRCEKLTESLTAYTRHLNDCLPFDTTNVQQAQLCESCGKKFETQNLYNWHTCVISQLSCPKCYKTFTTRAYTLKHIMNCEVKMKKELISGKTDQSNPKETFSNSNVCVMIPTSESHEYNVKQNQSDKNKKNKKNKRLTKKDMQRFDHLLKNAYQTLQYIKEEPKGEKNEDVSELELHGADSDSSEDDVQNELNTEIQIKEENVDIDHSDFDMIVPALNSSNNISSEKQECNLQKPTIRLKIKKEHGTLNSSLIDADNLIDLDVNLKRRKKKMKRTSKDLSENESNITYIKSELVNDSTDRSLDEENQLSTVSSVSSITDSVMNLNSQLPKIPLMFSEIEHSIPQPVSTNLTIKQEVMDVGSEEDRPQIKSESSEILDAFVKKENVKPEIDYTEDGQFLSLSECNQQFENSTNLDVSVNVESIQNSRTSSDTATFQIECEIDYEDCNNQRSGNEDKITTNIDAEIKKEIEFSNLTLVYSENNLNKSREQQHHDDFKKCSIEGTQTDENNQVPNENVEPDRVFTFKKIVLKHTNRFEGMEKTKNNSNEECISESVEKLPDENNTLENTENSLSTIEENIIMEEVSLKESNPNVNKDIIETVSDELNTKTNNQTRNKLSPTFDGKDPENVLNNNKKSEMNDKSIEVKSSGNDPDQKTEENESTTKSKDILSNDSQSAEKELWNSNRQEVAEEINHLKDDTKNLKIEILKVYSGEQACGLLADFLKENTNSKNEENSSLPKIFEKSADCLAEESSALLKLPKSQETNLIDDENHDSIEFTDENKKDSIVNATEDKDKRKVNIKEKIPLESNECKSDEDEPCNAKINSDFDYNEKNENVEKMTEELCEVIDSEIEPGKSSDCSITNDDIQEKIHNELAKETEDELMMDIERIVEDEEVISTEASDNIDVIEDDTFEPALTVLDNSVENIELDSEIQQSNDKSVENDSVKSDDDIQMSINKKLKLSPDIETSENNIELCESSVSDNKIVKKCAALIQPIENTSGNMNLQQSDDILGKDDNQASGTVLVSVEHRDKFEMEEDEITIKSTENNVEPNLQECSQTEKTQNDNQLPSTPRLKQFESDENTNNPIDEESKNLEKTASNFDIKSICTEDDSSNLSNDTSCNKNAEKFSEDVEEQLLEMNKSPPFEKNFFEIAENSNNINIEKELENEQL